MPLYSIPLYISMRNRKFWLSQLKFSNTSRIVVFFCVHESFSPTVSIYVVSPLFLHKSDTDWSSALWSTRLVRPVLAPRPVGPKFTFKTTAAGAKMKKAAALVRLDERRHARLKGIALSRTVRWRHEEKESKMACWSRRCSSIYRRKKVRCWVIFGALNSRARYSAPRRELRENACTRRNNFL